MSFDMANLFMKFSKVESGGIHGKDDSLKMVFTSRRGKYVHLLVLEKVGKKKMEIGEL